MSLYAQSESARDAPEAPAQVDPPTPGMSGGEIFRELRQHNDMRNAELKQYSAIRTYEVTNTSGRLYARQIVQLDYRAPDTKMFITTFEEGSGPVRHMVFKRLIESETDTAVGREHHDSSITPANYSFELVGEEQVGPYYCFATVSTIAFDAHGSELFTHCERFPASGSGPAAWTVSHPSEQRRPLDLQ
jgi:hypothetical protein